MIQLDDDYYWPYAAVDPDTSESLQTEFEPTGTNAIATQFFADLREKHDVEDATFLVDGATPLQEVCTRHGLCFRYERHGKRNGVERVFREVEQRTSSFSDCFSHADVETADQWLRSFAFAWDRLVRTPPSDRQCSDWQIRLFSDS